MMKSMALNKRIRLLLIATVGKLVYRLWVRSARTVVEGEESYKKLREQGKPVVLIIWHGRIFFAPFFFRNQDMMPMISPSGDGEILVRLASGWGFKFIRGSSSHSIIRAWASLKGELEKDGVVIIVPDGPKGPGRKMKAGALKLSQATGAAIVPVSFSTTRKKFLDTWDRFLLFRPFHRVVAVFGEPRIVSPDLTEEAFDQVRCEIEQQLTELDEWADQYFP